MGMGPAIRIEAPTRAPLPNGLFSVLTLTTPADPHWQLGAEWQPLDCDPLKTIGDPSCDTTPTFGLPKVFDAALLDGEATAFTVYGEFACLAAGRGAAGIQELAGQRLLGGEQTAVEHALWTGEAGNTPSFDKGGADNVGTAPLTPEQGLAEAEQFLGGSYAGQGVIHMSRYLASLLSQRLFPTGSVLRTALGTPVVAGGGYPNDGRIFVTGPLFGYRSDVFNSSGREGDLLDRQTNQMYAVAERTYLIGFDPCPLGVVTVT